MGALNAPAGQARECSRDAVGRSADLPVFNSLWIGDRLGPLHVLCLLSAVRQGHHVRLFGYRRYPDLPGEIEQADASAILPESEVYVHRRTGSPSLFSNRFRYELIAGGHGAWMDTDQLILAPVQARDGFIAGWENQRINGAVLLFPPDSALAEELLWWSRQRDFVPPWLPRTTRARLTIRKLCGLRNDVADHPWGTLGPLLFGYACIKHGYEERVSPNSRFSPVPYDERELPFRADGDPERYFTRQTEGVHLWHQGLRGGVSGRIVPDRREWIFEEGSFLWRMARELDLPKSEPWRL